MKRDDQAATPQLELERTRVASIECPHRRRQAEAKLAVRTVKWLWDSSKGPAMKPAPKVRLDAKHSRLRLEGMQLSLADSSPTAKDDAGVKWCALFPVGTKRFRPDFPGGSIDFTADFFTTMLANWAQAGRPALPVDYSHDEAGVAAGWIEDLALAGGYLWAAIRWTDDAAGEIKADKRRFLSPTFSTDGWDSTSGQTQGPTLFGAALLNTPFLFDLPRVAASSSGTTATPLKEQHVNKKMLCALLGLAETATDAEINAALEKRNAGDDKKATEAVELAVKPLRTSLEAKELELKAQAEASTKLAARVETLEKEKHAAGVKALCDKLLREGRLVADQQKAVETYAEKLGLAAAVDFFGKLPVVVKLGETGISGKDTEGDTTEKRAEYWKLVDEEREKHKLSTSEATTRINARRPELAKALTEKPTVLSPTAEA